MRLQCHRHRTTRDAYVPGQGDQAGEIERGEDDQRGEHRMVDPECSRDRGCAQETGPRRHADPGSDARASRRRAAQRAKRVEQVGDMGPRGAVARHERNQRRNDGNRGDDDDEAKRYCSHRGRADDDDPEDHEAHRPDHGEHTAHPPGSVVPVEPPREEHEPHAFADPDRHQAVDERPDAVTRGRVCAGHPAAAEAERRAPDPGARDQRADEAEGCRPQPDRARVLETADGAPDLPAGEPGDHGRGGEKDAGCGEAAAGDERA